MRLRNLELQLGALQRILLRVVRTVSPQGPTDILTTFMYRSEYFGSPFCAFAHAVMRGESDWTVGERELLGAFVSTLNQCTF
jgi:hypothetical protein